MDFNAHGGEDDEGDEGGEDSEGERLCWTGSSSAPCHPPSRKSTRVFGHNICESIWEI